MTGLPTVAAERPISLPVPQGQSTRLKVFISYARADSAFADELVAGLQFSGQFEISIDRHSIVEGEDWRRRLGALVADADTVVFLLSPNSVASATCRWEVDEATRLSKRILPILVHPIEPSSAPRALSALNYVRFDEGRSFMAGLVGLVRALNTDVDWLREHTRLLARAMEWDGAGKPGNRLLSGGDVEAAKAWLSRRPKDAPVATDLHLAFIRASEQAEADRGNAERKRLEEMAAAQAASAKALAEREVAVKALSRRTTVGLLTSGGLTVAAAGLYWWAADAERRFREEQKQAALAEDRRIDREALRTDIYGQLLAFATGPDQIAFDGPPGGNSPYTQTMIEELADERSSFQAALSRATEKVRAQARKLAGGAAAVQQQRPFVSTDLNGDIYLFRRPPTRRMRALVISTDRYEDNGLTLPNALRDAEAWEKLLKRAGFATRRIANPNKTETLAAIDDLSFDKPQKQGRLGNPLLHRAGIKLIEPVEAPPDTLVLVFYSGVGVEADGDNFIGLVETRATDGKTVRETAVNLTQVQNRLRERAAASILVMDTNFTRITPKPDSR